MSALLDDDAPWRTIADGGAPGLLELAAATNPREVKQLVRLKAKFPDVLVRVALDIVDARRRSIGRLEDAATLIADVAGVEQASRASVASWKAKRFAAAGAGRIVDLCCGIGADARHLARVAPTIGVDHLRARAFMAERYAGCETEVADVESRGVRGEFVHVDPSRRENESGKGSSRRAQGIEDLRPGPAVLDRILREARGGALKLGPGLDLATFPWRDVAEIELVSDGGQLVQAIAWFGDGFATPRRLRATRLPEGVSVFGDDEIVPPLPGDGETRRYVFLPDPAIERIRLLGLPEVAAGCIAGTGEPASLVELHAGLGVLTSDTAIESPWLERFEVAATIPWRLDRVRAWLREHDGGSVEVKTRGGAIDALEAQRELNGDGATSYVVFGLRLGHPIVAIVARRTR